MKDYLYRVIITEYPPGSMLQGEYGEYPNREWKPPGWEASDEWISRFHTTEFFWPTTYTDYKSRSGARTRARLIESYGAKTQILRSNEIVWPLGESL